MKEQAKELDAIPFDIPDVEFSHHEDKCTFDYIIEKYKLTEPALQTLAVIVRGADTDRHDIAGQASGLWAISAGLAYNTVDVRQGMSTEKGIEIFGNLSNGDTLAVRATDERKPGSSVFWKVTH